MICHRVIKTECLLPRIRLEKVKLHLKRKLIQKRQHGREINFKMLKHEHEDWKNKRPDEQNIKSHVKTSLIENKMPKLRMNDDGNSSDVECAGIAFMTKGDANRNDDFEILSRFTPPVRRNYENFIYDKRLMTNTSIIR